MQVQNQPSTPRWVRNVMCIAGALCVPSLVLAVALGAQPNAYTASAAGVYALATIKYAFSQ